ncbi:GNAT family N-acetyltransferase [Vibrio atypicus]|uniref:GNAT family N-acetyltransferase n=1 Tax=Vibrio atypicus TaxID=558271 RepID=UPI0037368192
MIRIRDYKPSDAPKLWTIFFDTIRNVNTQDYTQTQVEAWAPDNFDPAVWQKKMNAISPFVAEKRGEIVAYSDLQSDGLIDHFFCHHRYQGQGIGRSLMSHIFRVAHERNITRLYSNVSITARPFYEKMGFEMIKEQEIEVRGAVLRNYVMVKS